MSDRRPGQGISERARGVARRLASFGRGAVSPRRRARQPALPGVSQPGRWFVLFAALLCFSWQSVLAETHFHNPTEAAPHSLAVKQAAAKQAAAGQPGKQRAPAESPASCPICRELAHAHHYLPPAPIQFDAPGPALDPVLAAASSLPALAARWQGWRSRAPPLLRQA